MHQRGRKLRAGATIYVVFVGLLGLISAAALTAVKSAEAARPRAPAASEARAGSSDKVAGGPNIVLITTDDQTVSDMSAMPKVLARLGRRGTTFTNAFSPYPQCCPARASILTGQYAHNHHVMSNHAPWGGFDAFDDSNTLPIWLQHEGYRTALLGKYLNGYPDDDDPLYIPPGWDDWRAPIARIYDYRRYTINDNGVAEEHTKEYETGFVADEAVSVIDSLSGPRPFFLWAGFLAPHQGPPREPDDPSLIFPGSNIGTPAVEARYRDSLSFVPLPDKESINEQDVSDKPAYIRAMPVRPPGALRELNQQRLESLRSVDDAVERILDALDANGELSNTVIVFTSDNGYLIGEHRRLGKIIGYEESVRIPLIVAGPGFDTGSRRKQEVSLVDLAPTIAQVAGADVRLKQDGVSLRSIVRDATAHRSRTMLLQALPKRTHSGKRWYTAIRTDRYVYVRYDTHELELYDLLTDPLQLDNLAGAPSHRTIQRRLDRALDTLENCAGQTCRESVGELTRP
jgi:N-acetylglucosamine-6-sulfatase